MLRSTCSPRSYLSAASILHNNGYAHAAKESAFANVTHTIHFHGMDLVQAYDGTPGVPAAGLPEKLLGGVPVGGAYEYKFVPEYGGTYLYHCHIDSSTHILLGMYGAIEPPLLRSLSRSWRNEPRS